MARRWRCQLLALLDGLLERADVLRENLPHERDVEDVLAVEFADRRLRRIDRGLDGLRRGDRLDRLLTRIPGNHQHISSTLLKIPQQSGDMIPIAGFKAIKTPLSRPVPTPGTPAGGDVPTTHEISCPGHAMSCPVAG
jgi:hypothetical protein